jgi:hypothetical protein
MKLVGCFLCFSQDLLTRMQNSPQTKKRPRLVLKTDDSESRRQVTSSTLIRRQRLWMLSLSIIEWSWAFPYGSSITKLDDAQYFRPRFGVSSSLWCTIRSEKVRFVLSILRDLQPRACLRRLSYTYDGVISWTNLVVTVYGHQKGWQFTGFPLAAVRSTTGWVCDATMKIESRWECHPLKFICPPISDLRDLQVSKTIRGIVRRIVFF